MNATGAAWRINLRGQQGRARRRCGAQRIAFLQRFFAVNKDGNCSPVRFPAQTWKRIVIRKR
jgi:hypothetical protein